VKILLKKIALATIAGSLTLGLASCGTAEIIFLNSTKRTTLSVEGDKLYVMDLLNSKSFGQMQETIAANPQVNTLVFTAMPGSVDDEVTFEMGRWLRKQKLDTHLTAQSVIASGAVDLFLSGVNRTMEDGAKLGVHSWASGSKEAADFPRYAEEHQLNKDYIVAMDIPELFYWFTIYEAPADSMHWMTHDEILKYKLLTAPISSADTSGDIPFEKFEEKRSDFLTD